MIAIKGGKNIVSRNTKMKLLRKERLREDLWKFICESEEIAKIALPGQFIEMKVSETFEPFLRRPISIYNIDKINNSIELIFQVKGRGTRFLS